MISAGKIRGSGKKDCRSPIYSSGRYVVFQGESRRISAGAR